MLSDQIGLMLIKILADMHNEIFYFQNIGNDKIGNTEKPYQIHSPGIWTFDFQ